MFYELLLPLFSVDSENAETLEPQNLRKEISALPTQTGSFEDDIRSLEEKYGPLERGREINLTLQEILSICPRTRKRTDAYRKLISNLDKRFGTRLIISSRKGRKNE